MSRITLLSQIYFSNKSSKNDNVIKRVPNLFIIATAVLVAVSLLQTPVFIEASFLSSLIGAGGRDDSKWTIPLHMPDIRPDHGDQYLCIAHELAKEYDKKQWIVGFEPKANSSRIHHILLYSCELPGIYQPGEPKFVWDCSGMATAVASFSEADHSSSFESGPVCQGQESIIYGWALDARDLNLPEKVGFDVGSGKQKFLILQVHYHAAHHQNHHSESQRNDMESPISMPMDDSGLILKMQSEGITRSAGVLLMSSTGYVDSGLSKHEIMCQLAFDDEIGTELHPIYYRTHTHKFGYKVSGGKLIVKRPTDIIGEAELVPASFDLEVIGERNPQDPEMFYPVARDNIVISPGDTLYAACYYNQTYPWPVKIGATSDDEMCNFYIMYWTDGPWAVNQKTCVGANPPAPYESNYLMS